MWSCCACLHTVCSVGHLSHEFDNIQKDLFPFLRLESTSVMIIWQCQVAVKVSNLLILFKFWNLYSLSLSCEPEAQFMHWHIPFCPFDSDIWPIQRNFLLKKKMPVTYPSRVTLKGMRIDLLISNSPGLLFPAPALCITVSVPTLQWALSLPSNKRACNHSIASESSLDTPPTTLPATGLSIHSYTNVQY